jgi:hypothetical protein
MIPVSLKQLVWLAGSVLSLGLVLKAQPAGAAEAPDQRVYELRTYVTREGKLPDLLKRFREHTCRLFEKHGMQNIGYWVPLAKEDGSDNTLIYLIAHTSSEAAKSSWKAFGQDPEWKAAAQASEAQGKILAQKPEAVFLKTTDFSCAVKTGVGAGDRVFELRTYHTPEGKLEVLHRRFREHTCGLFEKHGMTNVGYWTPMGEEAGASNTLIYVLSHPSREAGLKAFESFRADPAWISAKQASEKEGSLTVQPGGVKSVYLKATDFSPIR